MAYSWINTSEIPLLNGDRIALFGAGRGSCELIRYLESSRIKAYIVCIADNDPTMHGKTFSGYVVVSPEMLSFMEFDKILVTSISGRQSISMQLQGMGFYENVDFFPVGRYPDPSISLFETMTCELESLDMLRNSDCLCVGPGGGLGFEILLYCFGARSVTAVDKLSFGNPYPFVSPELYGKLETHLKDLNFREHSYNLLDRFYSLFPGQDGKFLLDQGKIDFICPMDICDLDKNLGGFDFIFSSGVLEHVADPGKAVSCMSRALAPGGHAINRIVTQDHRSFSEVPGFMPFSYRFYNSADWENICLQRFYQNRVHPSGWKHIFQKEGFSVDFFSVGYHFPLDDEMVASFDSEFSGIPHKELSEVDCMIICSMP